MITLALRTKAGYRCNISLFHCKMKIFKKFWLKQWLWLMIKQNGFQSKFFFWWLINRGFSTFWRHLIYIVYSPTVLSRPFLLRRFFILTHTFEEWELHTFGRGGGSYKLKFKVKHRYIIKIRCFIFVNYLLPLSTHFLIIILFSYLLFFLCFSFVINFAHSFVYYL